jgi:hypothetical protein
MAVVVRICLTFAQVPVLTTREETWRLVVLPTWNSSLSSGAMLHKPEELICLTLLARQRMLQKMVLSSFLSSTMAISPKILRFRYVSSIIGCSLNLYNLSSFSSRTGCNMFRKRFLPRTSRPTSPHSIIFLLPSFTFSPRVSVLDIDLCCH